MASNRISNTLSRLEIDESVGITESLLTSPGCCRCEGKRLALGGSLVVFFSLAVVLFAVVKAPRLSESGPVLERDDEDAGYRILGKQFDCASRRVGLGVVKEDTATHRSRFRQSTLATDNLLVGRTGKQDADATTFWIIRTPFRRQLQSLHASKMLS